MSEIRYYFDENEELVVSQQLRALGFDVVSAHSLRTLGHTDRDYLRRANEMGRVLCAYDDDFARWALRIEHRGIILAQHNKTSIGDWIRGIRLIHLEMDAETIAARKLIFLPR